MGLFVAVVILLAIWLILASVLGGLLRHDLRAVRGLQ